MFEAIRIEVSATHKGRVRARVANLIAGTTAGKNLPQPLVWTALARTNYFVPRESFNIRSILMNPMMLSLVLREHLVQLSTHPLPILLVDRSSWEG